MNKRITKRKNMAEASLKAAARSSLGVSLATRENVSQWISIYEALPNPDPVLRKTSKRIEILDEIKREAHVAACTKSRKSGVLKRRWKIERENATPQAAEIAEKFFNSIKLRPLMRDALNGWGFGYQPIELLWRQEGSLWLPFEAVGKPPAYFCFGKDNELRLYRKNGINSDEVPPYKFLLSRYESTYENPYGEAQYSLSFWPTTFKKGGLKFWAMFAERFGMPHAIGKTPRSAGDDEKLDLLRALRGLISDAVATIPDDSSIELLEVRAGSGSADMYEGFARYHDGEISKVILGHSAAADSTPGRLGNENGAMEVRSDIIEDDSAMIMEVMDDLIRNIHAVNPVLGENTPKFTLYDEEDVDAIRADRDSKLLNTGKVKLKKSYFVKRYDFDEDDIDVVDEPQTETPPQFSAPEDETEGQELVDNMLTALTPEKMQSMAEKLSDPVRETIMSAESFEEAQKNLTAQFSKMDDKDLVAQLEKMMLLAHIAGSQPQETTK